VPSVLLGPGKVQNTMCCPFPHPSSGVLCPLWVAVLPTCQRNIENKLSYYICSLPANIPIFSTLPSSQENLCEGETSKRVYLDHDQAWASGMESSCHSYFQQFFTHASLALKLKRATSFEVLHLVSVRSGVAILVF